jgi:alkanesulfonate monooxygenase SsuD/methylene tetrahydromethanopterin reductase-like flavin-dependent oxidoreductase (luciferase family)
MPARRGLFLAPFDVLADPGLVGDLAARAEAVGWDGLFVWDHMLYSEPVRAIADPWICLAAIALRTERLLMGPMVTPLPRRRPHVLARQAASLDVLSGGRLVLGFGIGDDWGGGEFSRFRDEADPKVRGRMLDEGLEVLTGLLSGAPVHHDGEHYAATDVTFLPAPARPIPVWIAGRHPNAAPLRRAARYDGFFPIGVPEPAAVGGILESVAALRAGAPGPYDVVIDLQPGVDPAPWADAGATWVLTRVGPYELDLEAVRRLIDAGP